MAVLTAIGAAGVPGGSIPLLAVVLVQVGVPAELLALILGVDRLVDMTRTIRISLVSEQEDAVKLNDILDHVEQDLRNRLGLELQTRPTDASALGD